MKKNEKQHVDPRVKSEGRSRKYNSHSVIFRALLIFAVLSLLFIVKFIYFHQFTINTASKKERTEEDIRQDVIRDLKRLRFETEQETKFW